jgi:type IV pilus assembly protein PilC
MPLFTYKAKNTDGEVVEDVVQATNSKEVALMLKSDDMQVLSVKNLEKRSSLFGGSISVSEKAGFCRFLGTMLRAGLPLPEAMDIIRMETQSAKLKEVLFDISFNLRKGNTLSSVLGKYKSDFDSVFLTMVKAGEESGTIEKSFDYLAKQLLATYELSQKVKGSLMYPAVIMVAMVANAFIMLGFVLPKMSDVFLSFDAELPAVTSFVLGFGKTIGENLAMTIIVFFAFIVFCIMLFVIRSTRIMIFSGFVKLPIIRKVMLQLDVARFARTLSTLLNSGVPIMIALDVSSDVIKQPKLREEAKNFSTDVAKGRSLSDILLTGNKLFPATMIQTIRAGEKTGSLEIVLEELASFYEMEVDYGLKRSTALLEPLLMLVIGIAVGAMVVIMITPIYSILGGMEGL